MITAVQHSLPAAQPDFSAPARQAFQETQSRYQHEPQSGPAAVDFSRACFDLADFATNSAQRADLAEKGMAAGRRALALISNSAPAHYYLGMNLGQLARTKGMGALKLVSQMEHEFGFARALDEHLDYAGPDRNLGLLYRDAPVIASIGSRTKARQHLERAVELAPQYPENHLNLIESYLKWGYRAEAQRQLKALEEIWAAARAKLTGPRWASSWADWEPRFEKLKKKLEEPSKTLESPREKR